MTYPIRNAEDLIDEINKVLRRAHLVPLSLEAELQDGTRLPVSGVKTDDDEDDVAMKFVLCVGPKEEK